MLFESAPTVWSESRPSIGELDLDLILQESGRRASSRKQTPEHLARIAGLMKLFREAKNSDTQLYHLREVMSTSDFPILFGDVLDRQVLAMYQDWVPTWPNYIHRATVRDFRQVRRIALDGLSDRWYPDFAKAELTATKSENNLTEAQYTYGVSVYERAYDINWRMLVNDDLDAFSRLPQLIAQGARRTEEYFATTLFVDANGPHASFYTVGNLNKVTTVNGASGNNPALSIVGLQDAMTVLRSQRDPVTNEPIMVDMVELVVPPSLEVIAQNIMYATTIRAGGFGGGASGGGTADQGLDTVNWMRSKVRLSVNPYLPVVASSANGNTSWYLFANPDNNRPAVEMGFMRGFDSPQLFQKLPDMQRVGGGVDPAMGDFETGSIRYKGMMVFGGSTIDPKMSVASNGSGS